MSFEYFYLFILAIIIFDKYYQLFTLVFYDGDGKRDYTIKNKLQYLNLYCWLVKLNCSCTHLFSC